MMRKTFLIGFALIIPTLQAFVSPGRGVSRRTKLRETKRPYQSPYGRQSQPIPPYEASFGRNGEAVTNNEKRSAWANQKNSAGSQRQAAIDVDVYPSPEPSQTNNRGRQQSNQSRRDGMFSREAIAKTASEKTQTYRDQFVTGVTNDSYGNEYSSNFGTPGYRRRSASDPRWWDGSGSSPYDSTGRGSIAPYRVPYDNTGMHLGVLVASTLWWYVLSSMKMISSPPSNFFGLGEETIQIMGVLVTLSQVAMFSGCERLSKAQSLEEAQKLVYAMAAIFIPTNFFVSLVNPFEAKGIAVLACAEVTLCVGIFLSHYLRKASYREVPPFEGRIFSVRNDSLSGIFDYLRRYRPPPGQQATHSAVALTRSFASFSIATATLGQYLVYHDFSNPVAFAALSIVASHTALECGLIAVFPGARLDKFATFLGYESVLYSVHILAALFATAQSVFTNSGPLDTAWDQVLFLYLFLNALIKVMAKSTGLLSKINFDRILGLADLDNGSSR